MHLNIPTHRFHTRIRIALRSTVHPHTLQHRWQRMKHWFALRYQLSAYLLIYRLHLLSISATNNSWFYSELSDPFIMSARAKFNNHKLDVMRHCVHCPFPRAMLSLSPLLSCDRQTNRMINGLNKTFIIITHINNMQTKYNCTIKAK